MSSIADFLLFSQRESSHLLIQTKQIEEEVRLRANRRKSEASSLSSVEKALNRREGGKQQTPFLFKVFTRSIADRREDKVIGGVGLVPSLIESN